MKNVLLSFFNITNETKLTISRFFPYVISVVVSMGANLALVLILVRVLVPEIYGKVVLVKIALLIVTSLGGLGLSQATVRWLNLDQSDERVLPTVIVGTALLAVPASIIFLIILLLSVVVEIKEITLLIAMVSFMLVLLFMLNNELINCTRALHQPGSHALFSIYRSILQVSMIVYMTVNSKDIYGYIYGFTLSECILLVLIWISSFRKLSITFDCKFLIEMIRYGWPHTLVIVSGFLLTFSDRYMLAYLVSDNKIIAYYDASYMIISSILALIIRPFNLFLFPVYMNKYSTEGVEETSYFLSRIQKTYLYSIFLLAVLAIYFSDPLLSTLLPDKYVMASSIFPAVALGIILNGLFSVVVAGIYISENIIYVGISALIALCVNVLMNYILIPVFGLNGAAMSTAIAGLAQLLAGYYYSRNILLVKLPLALLLLGCLTLTFTYFIKL